MLKLNKGKLKGKTSDGEDVVYSVNDTDETASQFYDDLYKSSGNNAALSLFQKAVADSSYKTTKEIKKKAGNRDAQASKGTVVLATVKGDIHDIGKNIVKLLLENYGFTVADLGKDVPPETVLEAVERLHAPICGLSALMTTTVPAMAETVALVHEKAPWCRVMVGGAVLTEEYARDIGADGYGKDAMASVRLAERFMQEQA